jgi:rhodanese-related sulfurtransferase
VSAASEQIEIEPGRSPSAWATSRICSLDGRARRSRYEHEAGHIPEDRHIQLIELSSQAGTLEPERAVVFYCRTGSRSLMAAQAFRASGFEAYSMAGGLLRWAQEGRALAPEGGEVADH